jgi:hypothetical protein
MNRYGGCYMAATRFELALENDWLDDAVGCRINEIRLKSSAPTFSETDFVCQKTCVTRVV